MASVVSILVAARNNTNAAWRAARATATGALGAVATSARRANLSLRQISSAQLSAAARAANDLQQQADQAGREVRDLDRLIRQLGSAASPQLHRRLADARREADRLARAARQAGNDLRLMSRQNQRVGLLSRVTHGLADAMRVAGMFTAKWGSAGAAAIPVVAALGYIVGSLLPLLLTLPAAALAGAVAFGALKLGLSGVSTAISAGLAGNTEAYSKALKKLAPNAQAAVKAIVGLAPAWRAVQKATQNALFRDMDKQVVGVSNSLRPLAERWLPRIAESFNKAAREVGDFLAAKDTGGQLEGILRNISVIIHNVSQTAKPLVQILLDLASAASPRLASGSEGLLGWVRDLADKVRELKEDGTLGRWIDKAIENFGKLQESVENLTGFIAGMFKSGKEDGESFLDTLVKITDEMDKFSNSGPGQDSFKAWGGIIKAIATAIFWITMYANIATAVGGAWRAWGDELKGFWNLSVSLTQMLISAFLNAYDLILRGAVKAFGWIPGLGPKLEEAHRKFREFGDKVLDGLDRIKANSNININIRYRTIGNVPGRAGYLLPAEQSSTYISGSGGRASGGLATGLTWVGEQGRELVDMGARGGRVHSNGASERMAAQGGRGGVMRIELVASTGPRSNDFLYDAISYGIRTGALRLQVREGTSTVFAT